MRLALGLDRLLCALCVAVCTLCSCIATTPGRDCRIERLGSGDVTLAVVNDMILCVSCRSGTLAGACVFYGLV